MSIRLMTTVWDIEFPTQSQLLIALKMADFANDEGGSVYPSRDRLARNAQCSESTVKSVLRAFRAIGLLHVVRAGGNGPKRTTEYAWNMDLLAALKAADCAISGSSEELNIVWINKGAEFDPLAELRGQPEPLRGQPAAIKGAAGCPQSFTNHHKESSLGASAPATQGAARSTPEAVERLILAGDDTWRTWLNWLRDQGHTLAAAQFEAEGAMVAFGKVPGIGSKLPLLPPREGTASREALVARRGRMLRDPSDGTVRASGEAA